ncbi:MFS transporter [Amycolatopsis keratiniphila]|uniref:MFS transporter n=1 Tax=Amycolatopsis keratiniphila TaxID=129921 RepID=UPI0033E37FFC
MYIATSRGADAAADVPKSGVKRAVTGNVVALGLVSLVTDISSEMVTAVLPLYLVLGLGLSPLQFGVLDGLYSGVTAVVRLVGGHLADRWQKLKAVACFGYGISALGKIGLMLAGSSTVAIGAVLAADRTGKGVRTAPRDALITLSSDPEHLGRAFGVHRAMDTFGAFLGPLVAMAVLWLSLGSYDSVFFTSFCIAAIGVIILVVLVKDHQPKPRAERPKVSLRETAGLIRQASFRRICVWAALLGLVTLSDSFLYLVLQRRWELGAVFFPLLPLGTAGVYLLLAVPLGRLSDRIGRWKVFLGGHVALVVALLALLGPVDGGILAVLALVLHGVFYAATDGVLMAAAGPLLPEHQRAGGLALVQTGQATTRMLASVLFGLAWTTWDLHAAVLVAAGALAVVVVTAAVLRPLRTYA